jgi:hypothetical protein
MTKQIRRTEINIETHKITTIRSHSRLNPIYCLICRKPVATFSFEQLEAISQLLETKDFHLIQTIKGSLICGNSLEINK